MGKTKRKQKRRTFDEYIASIRKISMANSQQSILIGKTRETIVHAALWCLKNERRSIYEYFPTGKFSKNDMSGVDFIITAPVHNMHKTISISVVGPTFETEEKALHPNVDIIISVDFRKDSVENIALRIEKCITNYS